MTNHGHRRPWRFLRVLAMAAAFALLAAACASDDGGDGDEGDGGGEASGRTSLRWATSDIGSYGYAVASMMVDFLNRELPEGHVVTVHPYPSTSAAMKDAMDGNAEISYTADVGMVEFYDRGGPFEDYEPTTGDLLHTFYAYPMESFLVTTDELAEEYATYADFDGEDVFFTPAGFMNWLNFGRIFDVLGYEFNHVEIDSATVADALNGGTVVGAGSYTTAGASLPTWWREAELQVEIDAVEFTDDELSKLEDAGLETSAVDPSVAFSQDLGTDEVIGVPILFGYNMGLGMDEELVFQILEIFEAHTEDLASLDDGFIPLSEDFVGLQTGAIAAAPEIPVHPGLASFLQERDAWDDSWTIAE
jgi:TRAP-type uncharacterized transport system substrate-binding protein